MTLAPMSNARVARFVKPENASPTIATMSVVPLAKFVAMVSVKTILAPKSPALMVPSVVMASALVLAPPPPAKKENVAVTVPVNQIPASIKAVRPEKVASKDSASPRSAKTSSVVKVGCAIRQQANARMIPV